MNLFLGIQERLRELSTTFIFNTFSETVCGNFGTTFDITTFSLLGVCHALRKKKVLSFPRRASKKNLNISLSLDVNLFSC